METCPGDSFQSSSGALKDEVVSSVIVDEEEVIVEVDEPAKPVVCVDVMCENSPSHEDNDEEHSDGESRSRASPSSIGPDEEAVSCSPLAFDWSNDKMLFPPLSEVTQSEPNISASDDDPLQSAAADGDIDDYQNTVTDPADVVVEPESVDAMTTSSIAADFEPRSDEQPAMAAACPVIITSSRRSSGRVRFVVRVLSAVVVFFIVVMALTLETELDIPVINDLRAMPEVQQVAADYYWPWRQAVVDQYNALVGE